MRVNPIERLLYIAVKTIKAFDRRCNDIKYYNPDEVKNILVVSSTAIGDTLLSTPAIKAVRKQYPHARIIAHLNKTNKEMFENNPHIDGIIPYYGGYKRFFKTIIEFRRNKFDLILIFHGNEPQATPMAYLSCARFIVKLPNNSKYNFLLSNKEPVIKWEDLGHGISQRLKIASLVGCSTDDKRMVLPVTKENEEAVIGFLKKEGIEENDMLIGFQAGASTVSRMWFADRFVELGRKLIAKYPKTKIIITGSANEKDYCDSIAKGIGKRAVVSAGKLPLRQIPALAKMLKVLVTGDTGIMHVAIAVGTPVVALYAVSDGIRTGPCYDQERHRVIQKWKICDPCVAKKCDYQKCMENISVEEVYQTIIDLLHDKDICLPV